MVVTARVQSRHSKTPGPGQDICITRRNLRALLGEKADRLHPPLAGVRVEPCGRPAFVAANPETLKNANPEIDDRVQKGVRELLPQNARVKTVM
jgi:hypothetical protein